MGLKINRKKPESYYVEKALREQNAMLREIIKEMHALFREQSAFVNGVLVCELIDNPSENRAFEMARSMLVAGSTKIAQLATRDVVGK